MKILNLLMAVEYLLFCMVARKHQKKLNYIHKIQTARHLNQEIWTNFRYCNFHSCLSEPPWHCKIINMLPLCQNKLMAFCDLFTFNLVQIITDIDYCKPIYFRKRFIFAIFE